MEKYLADYLTFPSFEHAELIVTHATWHPLEFLQYMNANDYLALALMADAAIKYTQTLEKWYGELDGCL